MAKRQRHTPEQIISELREAEVKPAKGTALAQVCKELAITEQTYYRWRKDYTLLEARVLIERYRVRYNTVRPHSSLGHRPPAPEAIRPRTPDFVASLLGPASMAGTVGALT